MNKNKYIFCLLMFLISSICGAISADFNVHQEFPNYLADGVEHTNPAQVQSRLELIEKNIAALLKRVQLPYVLDNTVAIEGFFEHLLTELQSLVPTDSNGAPTHEISLSISGGVVRTMLAYIYKYVYEKKQKCIVSSMVKLDICSTEYLLNELHKKSQSKVSGAFVLGVGSDLDLLYTVSPRNEDLESQLKNKSLEFINSAEKKFGLDSYREPIKKSFIPVGDVKEYHEQIERTLSQGGCLLDTLAFEIKQPIYGNGPIRAPRLKAPEGFERILRDFLGGTYEYIKGDGLIEDKQSFRGVRPLLELPFLQLKNDQQLKSELSILLKKVNADPQSLSDRSLEQLEKMSRNAYFQGAHNRAFRSPSDSPLGLTLQIAQAVSKDRPFPYLPEFAYSVPLNKKVASTGKWALEVSQALVDYDAFEKSFTNKGKLFHGTNLANALPILRGGFVVSNERQGMAVFGPGVYFSDDEEFARAYGNFIFEVSLKRNAAILNWESLNRDLVDKLEREAQSLNYPHVFELLKHNYQIDVVKNFHVIVLNTAAVKEKHDLRAYLHALTRVAPVITKELSVNDIYHAINQHLNLLSLRQFLEGHSPENNPIEFFFSLMPALKSAGFLHVEKDYDFSKMLDNFVPTLEFEEMLRFVAVCPEWFAQFLCEFRFGYKQDFIPNLLRLAAEVERANDKQYLEKIGFFGKIESKLYNAFIAEWFTPTIDAKINQMLKETLIEGAEETKNIVRACFLYLMKQLKSNKRIGELNHVINGFLMLGIADESSLNNIKKIVRESFRYCEKAIFSLETNDIIAHLTFLKDNQLADYSSLKLLNGDVFAHQEHKSIIEKFPEFRLFDLQWRFPTEGYLFKVDEMVRDLPQLFELESIFRDQPVWTDSCKDLEAAIVRKSMAFAPRELNSMLNDLSSSLTSQHPWSQSLLETLRALNEPRLQQCLQDLKEKRKREKQEEEFWYAKLHEGEDPYGEWIPDYELAETKLSPEEYALWLEWDRRNNPLNYDDLW